MKKSDFYYDLPEELIAQTPIEPRDHSRMMVLSRSDDKVEHKHFYDIIDYLNEGMTTRNHKASLKERFRIMAKHYGWLSTIAHHGWFVIRLFYKP